MFGKQRQFWRLVKWIGLVALGLIMLSTITVLAVASWLPKTPKADYGIVLGAGIYSPALQERTAEGIRLARNAQVKTLVFAGGTAPGRKLSEAAYMSAYTKANGGVSIPTIIEDTSKNTYQNIRNSRMKTGPGSVIIVSDRFHLARGVLLALRAGYYPVYWSAPQANVYQSGESIYYYTREVFALIGYVPTFLCNCGLRPE
jgi:uncharacterized SAM-binding protein YcdF (DUF218 family)